MSEKEIDPRPYLPVPLASNIPAIISIRAVYQGTASPEQQKEALQYIIYTLCAFNQISYRPDSRDSAFAEGKRFVAHEIIMRINTDPLILKEETNATGTKPKSSRRV